MIDGMLQNRFNVLSIIVITVIIIMQTNKIYYRQVITIMLIIIVVIIYAVIIIIITVVLYQYHRYNPLNQCELKWLLIIIFILMLWNMFPSNGWCYHYYLQQFPYPEMPAISKTPANELFVQYFITITTYISSIWYENVPLNLRMIQWMYLIIRFMIE